MDKTKETHNSYGLAGFSRVSGSHGATLFGSQIKHSETITLTIRRAELTRDLSQFWYYGGEELIEIEMSPTQFAELLTTMNIGDGVPVTIRHVNRERMADPPYTSEREIIRNDYAKTVAGVTARFDECMAEIRKLVEKGKASKTDLAALACEMNIFQGHLKGNLPFVHTQFDEAIDKTVTQAKGEIEAFFTSAVQRMGIEAMQNGANKLLMPTIPDEADTEREHTPLP